MNAPLSTPPDPLGERFEDAVSHHVRRQSQASLFESLPEEVFARGEGGAMEVVG